MDKIIGFLITKDSFLPKFDFFKVGLNIITVQHNSHYLYLWGIGDVKKCLINNKYSLSFVLNESLLDRNILIGFDDENIILENDWLGSIPVFYNKIESIVSTVSNYCLKNKTIDSEGLSYFCEFGYSVFEKTMFRDIQFMRYFSRLIIADSIVVEYKPDPVLDKSFLENNSSEYGAIHLMQEYISDIESNIDGDIVLPTSGGYDSRILNYFIKDKKRIRSFTYGISKDQSKSDEVVHAKKISEIYHTKWEQIELREFHKYIDDWTDVYGFSTHLHGMYHIEFYKNISIIYDFSSSSFLSGIFGDIWAGSVKYQDLEIYQDVINLGYTHGLNLDLKYLDLKIDENLKLNYFKTNCKYFLSDKIKSVFTVRMKLMLISYLTQIPEYFGMPVWTPFLNFEIVKSTLNIEDSRRENRVWQKEFFKNVGLNLEDMNLKSVKCNKLDYEITKISTFEQIDISIMNNYIDNNRLIKINKILSNESLFERIKNQLLYIRNVGVFLKLFGFKNEVLSALHEYYVIKSIEKGLKYDS